MKKVVLFLIGLMFVSCSNDDSSNEEINDVKDVVITSYSKNYGTSGEIIKIEGENFPKKENCKIYFDDVLAEIVSVDSNGKEIQVKLPEIDSGIPKLKFDFVSKKIINNVNNEFNSKYWCCK